MRFASYIAAAATAATLAGAAQAQENAAGFYKGKTVTIIVGSSAGGGYDLYGRLLGRHMSKHLPGAPNFVVANMPGAGGNVAAAHIANLAPKDGTFIGAIFMGTVVEPLFTATRRTTHHPTKFNYIGSANTDYYVCIVRGDAPVKTFADLMETEIVVGASAGGASTRDFPLLLRNVLGAKLKIVAGYPGTREINLAIEKGEVQGGCGQSWSSVQSIYQAAFAEGRMRPIVQEDVQGYSELNKQGVPLARSFAKTEEQRRILDLVYSQTVFSRPYVVAQEVPADRVAALRKAFLETMADPELVAEAKKMKVDAEPVSGETLQAKVQEIYAAAPDIVEKARAAIAQ
ncbi:MAG TPA: tripartite tricarboxylate transporter substrate-binding protein [Beijerinckiaceae bacterium]|jgi:tripartite-type tricarboxylate transporter receptor subunit TctC